MWREITRIEEERRMPYITSVERMGLREGELRGQRAMLLKTVRARFGTAPEALERRGAAADQDALDRLEPIPKPCEGDRR